MKRCVDELDRLYADLLSDAEYAYPALRSDFERDRLRLTHMSSCRGLTFFMVDLPRLGKHLDRCLAHGLYSPPHLPAGKPVRKGVVVIPKFLRGLYLQIFDSSGRLLEDVDVQALLLLRQILYGAKKANQPCSEQAVRETISAFLDTDASLPMPPTVWVSPSSEGLGAEYRGFYADDTYNAAVRDSFGDKRGARILRRLDRLSAIVSLTLGPFRPQEWKCSHGPGVVSDVGSNENRYWFSNWSDRLETAFPCEEFAHHDLLAWADETLLDRRRSKEPSSRLLAVPKTLTKPRLIASEPSEHMFCQQNVKHYMYTRSAQSWINSFVDFHSQERNQRLALRGSTDGSLATLDLSEASDRVSCQVVGNVFRCNHGLLMALAATRTRYCQIGNDPDWVVEIRKYSTMGNATTFPVQSMIFLVVALTCCLEEVEGLITLQDIQRYSGLVSIFGDDIIVPTEVAGSVMQLLEALGFKVNTEKSYKDGLFRESCGVDAFRGENVTPVYWHGACDGTPESYSSVIETSNNFYKKFMVKTSAGIQRRSGRIRFPMVPLDSGVVGFESFVSPPMRFPSRWNQDLQREERRVPVFQTKPDVHPITDNTCLMQYFVESPEPGTPWRGGIRRRPETFIRHRWVPTTQFLRTECSSHRGYKPAGSMPARACVTPTQD